MEEVMVKSAGLSYRYIIRDDNDNETAIEALSDINFEIRKGQFIVICGRNGSGKSTLARHINALITPSEGTLWIDGMDSANPDNIWSIREKAGMIFQNPDNQLVASVVEEDVAFGPENLGIPAEEIRRRVDEALATVGMSEHASENPSKLSGGQKQRVGIAGVLAMRTEAIVLDEPTAMLDPSGRAEIIRTMHELNKNEGITVILITHYMEEAVDADAIFVIDDGKLVLSGTPREIFPQTARLRELGLDTTPMAELAGILREKGYDIRPDLLTVEEMAGELCR